MTDLNIFNPHSPTWCPGCGNYGIWSALKNSIRNLGWDSDKYVLVYGVGCSGNMTDFVKAHGFHSLHGRAVPNAIGIKFANHSLNVICEAGDGDCYGEGGNHLLHAIRGNFDIKLLVHDNRVYGLTTGQTAPTSGQGYKSKSTPGGVIEYPVNPLAIAIIQGASMVAQGFAGDNIHLTTLITEVLQHRGFALLNILQPCVTFNKINTYQYYRERVYKLKGNEYDTGSREEALKKVFEQSEHIPLGVIFRSERPPYHEQIELLKEKPLVLHDFDINLTVKSLAEEFLETQDEFSAWKSG